jgi:hypothetical protein
MKTQQNFSGKFSKGIFQRNFPADFQQNFSKLKEIFQDKNQENFPQSFVEGAVQNFIAGVGSLAKKAKEVEEDARKRFCDYPSA